MASFPPGCQPPRFLLAGPDCTRVLNGKERSRLLVAEFQCSTVISSVTGAVGPLISRGSLLAFLAVKTKSEHPTPALLGRDPRPNHPRRIVADMLVVSAR